MGHQQQALEKALNVSPLPADHLGQAQGPPNDWLTTLLTILQSLSVIITCEWHSQTLILLFWALLEVKAGFRVIPTKIFEKRPSCPVKTADM